ncbi:DNA polymerase theta [Copidosoma floridanum]|uniref:DNA polymerase theta n=1 Tax=Copidosoma floridanum TaxID=29053 RepID=UPI000C6F6376|nr:DNA polymerase theta [Copidosoma floridanum]
MSQKSSVRKKRVKTTLTTDNSLKKVDSDIAEYFDDILSFVPENNRTKRTRVSVIREDNGVVVPIISVKRANSRAVGSKAKVAAENVSAPVLPAKRCKSILGNRGESEDDDKSESSHVTPTHLSVLRTQNFCASFKNGKSNIFDGLTQGSSKILSLQALSDVDSEKRLELSSWGLPALVLEKYQARGVRKMFSWQVECLANKKILEENKNLVYSAPTSAGKTLVAEFLLLKTVLERRKKVIFILPFVSVVREKMFYFQDLLTDSGVRVEGFMGGVAPSGGFSAVHVAIATIEKANSLINRLMQDGDLATLGAVVIDELHLLGDSSRGYLLELLLTKLRYMTLNLEHVNIQLIGMSATLPNLPLIAEWLDAELYKTDFRPIPLQEQCKIGSSLFDRNLKEVRQLEPAPDIVNDLDGIIQLCIETINGGHGVLIFCPTKNWCEKLATQMASTFFQLGRDKTPHGQILRKHIESTAVEEVLEQLKSCPVGLDNVLRKTVSFGVAFHHAGLTMDERDIIEGGFRVGSLKVLIATSTLSSGVNLPARRVIIRSPLFGGKLLDKLTYQQMIGRAGRMGKDTAGESILMCNQNERSAASNLMTSSIEPIVSCLKDSGPLVRALLEAIASQIVRTPRDLDFYSKCTFVYKCEDNEVKNLVNEAVTFLISNEFLLVKDVEGDEQRMVATCLGKACLSASVPPRDALFLFEELQRARKCFVLDTELHVIYLVTPFNAGSQIGQIDWMSFLELWRSLSESERRVGQLVGVEERFLMTAIRGVVKSGKKLNIHRRFYTALALYDLVREVPLNAVCRKYSCCRGLLQSLQQSSATFAGMVTSFCKELKWDCMELLFAQFQTRLQFGVCRDLLDLLRLPSLNGLRARSLFKQGITTVAELAAANELDVEEALNKALPFESKKDFDGGNEMEIEKRTKMRTVFITGKDGLTAREAALIVIKEARVLLKNELGVCDLQWSQNHKNGVQGSPRFSGINAISSNHLSLSNLLPLSRSPSFEVRTVTTEAVINKFEEKSMEVGEKNYKPSTSEKSIDNRNATAALKNHNLISISKSSDKIENQVSITEELNSISKSLNITERFVNENQATMMEKSFSDLEAKKTPENKTCISESGSEILSTSLEDIINESDKIQDASKTLRSKLAERTKSFLKEDQITIRSLDFEDEINSLIDQSPKIKQKPQRPVQSNAKSQSLDSFQMSERAISEIMQVVEKQNEDVFQVPAPVVAARSEEEKKRTSIGSNSSKSPSLFSDSSFLDAQVCSILEKNVIETCFTDSEKNDTPPNSSKNTRTRELPVNGKGSINSPSTLKQTTSICSTSTSKNVKNNPIDKNSSSAKVQQLYESKTSDLKQISMPMTWNDDSWDRTGNIQPNKEKENVTDENLDKGSPSILHISKIRTRRPLITTQIGPKKIEGTINKNRSRDSPLIGTPKPVLQKRASGKESAENKVVACGIKNSSSHKANMPIVFSSNQSDSEDSVGSSQITVKTVINKTRSRIDQKIMATQKLRKSTMDKSSSAKITCDSTSKLVKQNSDFFSEDTTTSDNDSSESCLMFDSDDTFNSRPKKSKRITGSTASDQMLRSNSCMSTWSSDEIIDSSSVKLVNVATSKQTFRLFRNEVKRKNMAIALVTEPYNRDPVLTIGGRIVGTENKKNTKKTEPFVYKNSKVRGVIFSWGMKAVYYVPFNNSIGETLVTIKERMNLLREILSDPTVSLRCFKAKEVYKFLYVCCEIQSSCEFLDPLTADWLMNSESVYKSNIEMAVEYFPSGMDLVKNCENNFGSGTEECARATVRALLAWYTTKAILEIFKEHCPSLLVAYREIEMPTVIILAKMELRGFGINMSSLRELTTVMKNDLIRIEEKAYSLAGRKFNFNSSKEVSAVLGLSRRGRACTNKAALKSCENPISDLVTMWRKLKNVETKIIFPLLHFEMKNDRIHGTCITHTVTGRVSMHEPNLQCIPRDFKSDISGCIFSTRMAFVPSEGNVMLSADFCQLELRILAHFSQDRVLCNLFHQDGDIFKNIAARLNKVTEEMVNDEMRQRAKQLCYAMIYGMGSKSLAQSLSVTESEAKDYLETFMGTYKEIRVWLNAVSEKARIDGYVSTLMDRRRVLSGIKSEVPAVKAQAERQAVNTKVQGSAADITKKAMVLIENKLREKFSCLPVTFPTTQTQTQTRRGLRSNYGDWRPRGAYLILQLHDELLYEVNSNDLEVVARIVKESMENAFKLSVPLPVKMRVGSAWGNLEEYEIQD